MRVLTIVILIIAVLASTSVLGKAVQNKTNHHRKENGERIFDTEKLPSYRSFQPVSIKYHKIFYPQKEDRNDYDITSYDTEYGGVVSNFTGSIYDDNPPLYPNPEILAKSNQVLMKTRGTHLLETTELDLPDDSLADADLKEHNIIDSLTYLYGFNNCQVRTEYMALIFIASGLTIVLLSSSLLWLMWGEHAKQFRETSKLYPLVINLCCCFEACNLIYIKAVMGSVSSPSQCEKIALLLHYTHLCCAVWIVVISVFVTQFVTCDNLIPIKYMYLISYGVPAVIVMFNYALSMEHYEIKHYCWMSIEKGMVVGFMIPAMVLILVNTGTVIIGLQSVNRKQAEILQAKIQEIVDNTVANWPVEALQSPSVDQIDVLYTPSSSKKNSDSFENIDISDDENSNGNNEQWGAHGPQNQCRSKILEDKNLLNMLAMDDNSWKASLANETQQLKIYLNLLLVTEPFFAINWVMGVLAVENAAHWPTPALYLILLQAMYIYMSVTLCTSFPILQEEKEEQPPPCCEEVVVRPTLTRSRTTDSIPLLDPAIQQPNQTPAPADTISTISI